MKPHHEGQMVIEHPNRAKASSKTSRLVMVLLLLGSAGLIGLIIVGGWSVLMGMKIIAIGWVLLYLLFAFYVARWNRGVLPVVAALSIIMLIFAVIAVPTWVDRDSASYASSALSAGLLATLTAILVALQGVMCVFAMHAFNQQWNVEVEHYPAEEPDYVPLGI